MDELLDAALRAAGVPGIREADVRLFAPARAEFLCVRNGVPTALTSSTAAGLGVRVRTDRAWGFAATGQLTRADARRAAGLAVRLARAASRSSTEPLPLTEEVGPAGARFASAVRSDPFSVPREEKLALLTEAERRLHVASAVKSGEASFHAWRERKWFRSSAGSSYSSDITQVGAGIAATAIRGSEVQRRSYPTSFGGDFASAGWEFVRGLDLPAHAERIGREAVALLSAPAPPAGPTTLVLASDQLALQVHESIGHATEADRILALEAGYAGTSWVRPSDVGTLRYGSPLLHIVADATEPRGLGSFGYDDEGLPARRVPLIQAGRLVGLQSSRECAARLRLGQSGAAMRAEGYHRTPLIRMTNIDLAAGDATLPELLEGVTEGVYLETNRSWSIDDRRLNFQFGTEVGRRIVKGELGPLLRNPIYAGMTPAFWSSMDKVGDASTWHLWGLPNCGKGQPGQAGHVGHGAPAARFREVQVRGAGR